jgi:hypothetical protein
LREAQGSQSAHHGFALFRRVGRRSTLAGLVLASADVALRAVANDVFIG